MSTTKVSLASLARSRISERLQASPIPGSQELPLARIESEEREARQYRIVLGRIDRSDTRAFVVNGSAQGSETVFPNAAYSFTAGEQQGPSVAPPAGPLRDNVLPLGVYAVRVRFGTGHGAVNEMIATWPHTGGGVTVYGSYVEVFALVLLTPPLGSVLPVFSASIVPSDGAGDGAELSIVEPASELIAYANGACAIQYVPDFARRVRVSVGRATALDFVGAIPEFSGIPPTLLLWIDEQANVVHSALQCGSNDPLQANAQVTWQEVPPNAVMLVIACDVAFVNYFASAHWKIAP